MASIVHPITYIHVLCLMQKHVSVLSLFLVKHLLTKSTISICMSCLYHFVSLQLILWMRDSLSFSLRCTSCVISCFALSSAGLAQLLSNLSLMSVENFYSSSRSLHTSFSLFTNKPLFFPSINSLKLIMDEFHLPHVLVQPAS